MSSTIRTIAIAIFVTAIVAAFAGWGGVQYGLRHAQSRPELDDVLHHDLQLTAEQSRRIDSLEADFVLRRRGAEAEMNAANRDLAAALEADHAYSLRARAAVERFHSAMGRLQEMTIRHVMAMRQVLTPDQAAEFDAAIHRILVEKKP